MTYRNPETRRERDRERFLRRTAERRAKGLCPRCGRTSPAPGRSLCDPCTEKRNAAGRARDTKLRAAGKLRRDPQKARACRRRHYRRQTSERLARGDCARCGKRPAVPERKMCELCIDKRRKAERVRYAQAGAEGKKYGGRDPGVKRRSARAASRKRHQARRAAGLCVRCGARPADEGSATCQPCRQARRAAERELYAERCGAGLCVRCGGPTMEHGSRCAPCAVIEAERGSPRDEELSSILHLIILSDGKPGHRMSF